MELISSAFQDGEMIPDRYSCRGDNISPPLEFVDISSSAKSFALVLDDPDAPSGSFIHWVVYDIDPNVSKIEEDSIPQGAIVGQNSMGKTYYVGPCPPSGVHHYVFKAFALDTILNLGQIDWYALEEAMDRHIIDKAELVGTYGKIGS
jgi:hypothetical protein